MTNSDEDWLQGLIDQVNNTVLGAAREQHEEAARDRLEGPIIGRARDLQRGVEVEVDEAGSITKLVLSDQWRQLSSTHMGEVIVALVRRANQDHAAQRAARNARFKRS